jgi:peroxiredoxin
MSAMTRSAAVALAAAILASPALAAPQIGQPAPAFQARDADGKLVSLAEFRGKTVVLEWHNPGCPYVQKHYNSGNMQHLQQEATQEGVAWLTIDSSAPGFQGYLAGADAKGWKAKHGAHSTDLLLDPDGKVGRLYEAKNTPHMFVIDKGGTLVYEGGIDNRPYADPASLKGATNYVQAALDDLKAGRAVAHPVSQPYGCSVKYSSAD